jgi:hypothetical protein
LTIQRDKIKFFFCDNDHQDQTDRIRIINYGMAFSN